MKNFIISILEKIIIFFKLPPKLVLQENPEYDVKPYGKYYNLPLIQELNKIVKQQLGKDYKVKKVDVKQTIYLNGNNKSDLRRVVDENVLIITNGKYTLTTSYPINEQNFIDAISLLKGTSEAKK